MGFQGKAAAVSAQNTETCAPGRHAQNPTGKNQRKRSIFGFTSTNYSEQMSNASEYSFFRFPSGKSLVGAVTSE